MLRPRGRGILQAIGAGLCFGRFAKIACRRIKCRSRLTLLTLPTSVCGKVNKVRVREMFLQAGVVGASQKQQG
jgi:hypothetical protein